VTSCDGGAASDGDDAMQWSWSWAAAAQRSGRGQCEQRRWGRAVMRRSQTAVTVASVDEEATIE
jgi:hypothetical protein